MRPLPLLVSLTVAAVAAAGCFGGKEKTAEPEPDLRLDPASGLYVLEAERAGGTLTVRWAPGAVSELAWDGNGSLQARLPDKTLVVRDARFELGDVVVFQGPGSVPFLTPPAVARLVVQADGELVLDPAAAGLPPSSVQAVSGERMWNLSAHQETEFPHREPGHENYGRSIAYFQAYFEDLGYETEIDPFGTQGLSEGPLCIPVRGGTVCPESLANVVAWKPGTEEPDKVIFVGGGHFDMVSGTTHAAFDDTSGTVMTLELARALAPYEFRHTIMFGLWGGEENGILGSQFWIQSNPEMRTRVMSYWNLDVVGMSWPAPLPRPDPVVIAAGPDVPGGTAGEGAGPVAEDLLAWARTLQTDWFGFPDEATSSRDGDTYPVFLYEGVASGQAAGYAGVNAQSDHTPFMAAGIPSWFIFNGDTLAGDNPIGIHNERDTLNNMTKYAYFADDAVLDDPSWPDEATFEEAKAALAQSWEAVAWFPFYHAVLTDLGVYAPPGVAP